MISQQSVTELSVWNYLIFRSDYWSSIYHAMENFLDGNVTMTNAKKTFRKSLRYAFTQSAKEAWIDGGGVLPLSKEAKDYVRKYTQEQLVFLNDMFAKAKQLKKSGQYIDVQKMAQEKADLWSRSVDIVYNNVKIMNAGNIMLTFDGDDGFESCEDCTYYKGKRHKASWWIKNNAIPPARHFSCGGFKCAHFLRDDNGKIFTL